MHVRNEQYGKGLAFTVAGLILYGLFYLVGVFRGIAEARRNYIAPGLGNVPVDADYVRRRLVCPDSREKVDAVRRNFDLPTANPLAPRLQGSDYTSRTTNTRVEGDEGVIP